MQASSYEQYKTQVDTLYESLLQVEEDSKLEQAGFRFFFAVDFAELFLCIHPLASIADEFLHELGDDPTDEKLAEALSRQRAALSFLFRRLPGPLVLLPPYAAELWTHLKSIKHRGIKFVGGHGLLDTVGKTLLKRLSNDLLIQGVLQSVRKGRALKTYEKLCLVKMIAENYRDIWTVLTTDRIGLKYVVDLLRSDRSSLLRKVFPNMPVSYETVSQKASEWLGGISEIDIRRDRPYQNTNDANAFEYLKQANEWLNPQGKLLVLVSHSKAMREKLNKRPFIELPGWDKKVAPIRGLRYVLRRLLCSDTTNKIDPVQLAPQLDTINRLHRQLEDLKAQGCKKIPDEEFKSEMETAGRLLDGHRNLCEFVQTKSKDLEDLSANTGIADDFATSSQIDTDVLRLLLDHIELKREVEARANDLWIEVNEHSRNLVLILSLDAPTVEYLIKYAAPNSRPIPLRVATDQLLYVPQLLEKLDSPIRQVVEKILLSGGTVSTDDSFRDGMKFLYGRCWDSDDAPAASAALAIICMHIGEWDIAKEVVEKGLVAADEETPLWDELVLLESTLQRNLMFKAESLGERLEKWLQGIAARGDPRAWLELGIWYGIKFIQSDQNLDSKTLTEAIECIEKARSREPLEENLRLNLIDKQAYFLAERNHEGDLSKAEELLGELSGRLSSRADTSCRGRGISLLEGHFEKAIAEGANLAFSDTVGFIYYRKAEWAVKRGEEWVPWQKQACERLEAVLTEGKRLLPWQRSLVSQHLDYARSVGRDSQSTDV